MNFLDRALPLLERGFSLIPIAPNDKRPIGGFGATRRTRDRAVIESWAEQFPDANVGIVADENICILESDDVVRLYEMLNSSGASGSDWGEFITLMACGSSENRPHFFFRHTEMSRNIGNTSVPGLFECRFLNQYVVGAGSVHPDGSVYRWLNEGPVSSIPDWLVLELARLAMTGKRTMDRVIETVGEKIPEGSRHYFLMREAGKLWDGKKTGEEMVLRLDEINQKHCDPPRSFDHIDQCVRDIMGRTPYDPGPKVLVGSRGALSSGPESASVPTQPEVEIWTALSAEELVKKDIPARNPIVVESENGSEGQVLFYEQSINQILAWRGVGKTNFALGVAGAIASGKRILDFSSTGAKRVLYLDGELPAAQLQERVKAFVGEEGRENLKFFSPEMRKTPKALNLLNTDDREALERLLDDLQPQVIFLDSQSTLMVGDSNKDDFQEQRMQLLRDLRWRGLCVIEMHHVGKGGMQRGLSKNDDVLDVQMYLQKSKDWEPEDGLEFEVKYEKIRHAARLDTNYKVNLVDGKWVKQAANEVALVSELRNKGLSYRDIEKKTKISRGRVERLVKKGLKLGLVDAAIKIKSED